jgi:hypothetical protein
MSSWWTVYAGPEPRRDAFVAEVMTRQAHRIDTSRKAAHRPKDPALIRPEERTCAREGCENRFAVKARGKQAEFCSQFCNAKAWREKQKSA